MRTTFDPTKRAITLERRRLDFLEAEKVIAKPVSEQEDARRDYGEVRIQTVGWTVG